MYKRKKTSDNNNASADSSQELQAIEVEAPTVAEAIKKALKTLHTTKKEVTIEVLKEEHKGLFGMEGAEPAKIRVTPKHA